MSLCHFFLTFVPKWKQNGPQVSPKNPKDQGWPRTSSFTGCWWFVYRLFDQVYNFCWVFDKLFNGFETARRPKHKGEKLRQNQLGSIQVQDTCILAARHEPYTGPNGEISGCLQAAMVLIAPSFRWNVRLITFTLSSIVPLDCRKLHTQNMGR